MKFQFGFIIGRFNHIHKGHERMIDYGLEICENLLVLVGSAQESGTIRNPFGVLTRLEAIRLIYGDKVKLGFVPDMTHENDITPDWGRYVLEKVKIWGEFHGIGSAPDVTIYGNDENRAGWYDPKDIEGLAQVIIPRGKLKISATELREMIAKGKRKSWGEYVNPAIHHMYEDFRSQLIEIPYYSKAMEGTKND